ncbi:MAG: hypothetical protein NDJ24_07225 [Alphaproteobacteria bacterium]|nr:hypothetical protein [Alphaproteobacteria bacterium]
MEDLNEQPVLRVRPEMGERFLPNDFYDVLAHRYFPVLSLTYIASIVGVAIKVARPEAGFFHYFFEDPYAYRMGYWVAAWVSIPAILWILIRSTFHLGDVADLWYKVTAVLMVSTLLISLLLFPMGEFGFAVRLFMVATIPILVVQYFFFVRGGLPPTMAWPLTVAGVTFLTYGLIL